MIEQLANKADQFKQMILARCLEDKLEPTVEDRINEAAAMFDCWSGMGQRTDGVFVVSAIQVAGRIETKRLGRFETAEAASEAYASAKLAFIDAAI